MKKLFIIDAFNLIYRMFYAIPPMTTREGRPVNAVYGVAKFLLSLWQNREVDALVVASDAGGESVRTQLYDQYKATRDRMPDTLRSQLDDIFTLFRLLEIPILEQEGYEADDIIGSLASGVIRTEHTENELIVISSDKDLCQFIHDGRVRIYDAMKQKNITRKEVEEKFHVTPSQIADYLAIVGDTSDNIPGISGFGPKKAEDLLGKYGSLENIYTHLDDIPEKVRVVLIEQKDQAFLSYALASIHTDLDVTYDSVKSRFDTSREFWSPSVVAFFREREFLSLLPFEFQEEKKVFELPQVVEISDEKNLISLEEKLHAIQKEQGSVTIATSGSRFSLEEIVIGVQDILYRIVPKNLEIRDFLMWLMESDIQIIGYDLTIDIERISGYIRGSLTQVEGQTRLF